MKEKKDVVRPAWIHGTNEGRVEVKVRGPGETMVVSEEKGKAQVGMGVSVRAAEDAGNEGGYRR